jgi:hypothetical protein
MIAIWGGDSSYRGEKILPPRVQSSLPCLRGLPQPHAPSPTEDGRGAHLVTSPDGVIDRLKAMRGLSESYSDVIIRVARGDGSAFTIPTYAATLNIGGPYARRVWYRSASLRTDCIGVVGLSRGLRLSQAMRPRSRRLYARRSHMSS